jgi:hypothetical protein
VKLASRVKFFGLILPIIGLLIFLSLQLPVPAQPSPEEISSSNPNPRTTVTTWPEAGVDPRSASQTLPTPKTKTITDTSAGPTPIAVTGLDRVVLPTPTEANVPESTVGQAVADLPVPTTPAIRPSGQVNALPALDDFIQQVADGQMDVLRGVYVAGVMALRIVEQPDGDVAFISEEDGTATHFQSAAVYGVVGLLAHNFLSGALFHDLTLDQEVTLIYDDGRLENYRISRIADFERLTISDLQSDFRSLATDQISTVEDVFFDFYGGEPHLTLQTCIEKDGIWNWGVRFIVAEPID